MARVAERLDRLSGLSARERETAGAKRAARLGYCKAHDHRWWPLDEPGDVSDHDALACCLNCSTLKPLREVMK